MPLNCEATDGVAVGVELVELMVDSEVNESEALLTLLDGKTITLVDTPGFDDTVKTEAEILRVIADFLAATYVPLAASLCHDSQKIMQL